MNAESKPVFHLVACCATKLGRPAEARDLYCSQWFRKVRKLIESRGEQWVILSAYYNLVQPESVLRPYNVTLADKSAAERREWADIIATVLPGLVYNTTGRFLKDVQVVIWGGQLYTEHLAERLGAVLPLRGLGIGSQLGQLTRWLDGRDQLALVSEAGLCDSAGGQSDAQKVASALTEGGQICGINTNFPQGDTGPGDRPAVVRDTNKVCEYRLADHRPRAPLESIERGLDEHPRRQNDCMARPHPGARGARHQDDPGPPGDDAQKRHQPTDARGAQGHQRDDRQGDRGHHGDAGHLRDRRRPRLPGLPPGGHQHRQGRQGRHEAGAAGHRIRGRQPGPARRQCGQAGGGRDDQRPGLQPGARGPEQGDPPRADGLGAAHAGRRHERGRAATTAHRNDRHRGRRAGRARHREQSTQRADR